MSGTIQGRLAHFKSETKFLCFRRFRNVQILADLLGEHVVNFGVTRNR